MLTNSSMSSLSRLMTESYCTRHSVSLLWCLYDVYIIGKPKALLNYLYISLQVQWSVSFSSSPYLRYYNSRKLSTVSYFSLPAVALGLAILLEAISSGHGDCPRGAHQLERSLRRSGLQSALLGGRVVLFPRNPQASHHHDGPVRRRGWVRHPSCVQPVFLLTSWTIKFDNWFMSWKMTKNS